jgi:cyclic pyranopterin phosphate synthase
MRSGISDDELKQHIQKAIDLKPEKHEFSEKPQKLVRFMSMTGG